MDWHDTPAQAAFRAEVRELIDKQLPERYRAVAGANRPEPHFLWETDRASGEPGRTSASREWADAVRVRGWLAPHWPREYGGGGLSKMEQFILKQEMTAAGAPLPGSNVGIDMLGPVLILHGTEDQRRDHLPRILSGETVWAQGYSEPGAGSDLASLATRAVRDGDEYVVNGQKIWTTHAHQADWLLVLTRTEPDAPKHRGISFLLTDIRTPGITIRPLVNMAWWHDFNETFFEDVRIPASQRVGEENRGWYVAMTLLDHERSRITDAIESQRAIRRLIDYTQTDHGRARNRFAARRSVVLQLVDRLIESEVMFNFSLRIITMQEKGLVPNYEASVSKFFGGELQQRVARSGMAAFGLYGQLWDPDDPRAPMEAWFNQQYARTAASTIGGGTAEIQRNVVATRGLGLPRG